MCYTHIIMRTYIVFDLEWNQSPDGKQNTNEDLPFEIIEIGAVKMNERLEFIDEYHRLVLPQIYTRLHYRISQVTHLNIQELRRVGVPFPEAAGELMEWCGTDPVFCTWGSMDLTELQRNMSFYELDLPFPFPLCYLDIQKLYALQMGSRESPSLDSAAQSLGLLEDRPFHRAQDDAYYTGKVMQAIDFVTWSPYFSVDYYRLPRNKEEEIRLTFPTYMKYVSRVYPSGEEALADKDVTDMICFRCRRMLKKKIRWFPVHSRQYLCLSVCPEHGPVRGKIRIRKQGENGVYIVKTLKCVDEETADRVEAQSREYQARVIQWRKMKKRSKKSS